MSVAGLNSLCVCSRRRSTTTRTSIALNNGQCIVFRVINQKDNTYVKQTYNNPRYMLQRSLMHVLNLMISSGGAAEFSRL